MENFSVPPSGEAIKNGPPLSAQTTTSSTNSETKQTAPATDAFRNNIDVAMLEAERPNITEPMRTSFLYSLMLQEPFTQTYSLGADGVFTVTFGVKKMGDVHKAQEWMRERLEKLQTTAEYFDALTETEVAAYLWNEKHLVDGKPAEVDYTTMPFVMRMRAVATMSAVKYAIIVRLMLKFICRCELMSQELLEQGPI